MSSHYKIFQASFKRSNIKNTYIFYHSCSVIAIFLRSILMNRPHPPSASFVICSGKILSEDESNTNLPQIKWRQKAHLPFVSSFLIKRTIKIGAVAYGWITNREIIMKLHFPNTMIHQGSSRPITQFRFVAENRGIRPTRPRLVQRRPNLICATSLLARGYYLGKQYLKYDVKRSVICL